MSPILTVLKARDCVPYRPWLPQEQILRVFSFGGGRQSVAALVLAAHGLLPYRRFIFALTGAKSEHPDTLVYIDEIARPYAAAHGLELIIVQKVDRCKQPVDLYDRITDPQRKGLQIPVRLDRTGKPAKRLCTADFKVEIIDKWVRAELARGHEAGEYTWLKADVAIGFTIDEAYRLKPDNPDSIRHLEYPLFTIGLTVQDCVAIIEREGLPVPPKSACLFFRPFMSLSANIHLRNTRPDLFQKKVELERYLTERRAKDGDGLVWMTDQGQRHKLTLDQIAGEQADMFADDERTPYMCDGDIVLPKHERYVHIGRAAALMLPSSVM